LSRHIKNSAHEKLMQHGWKGARRFFQSEITALWDGSIALGGFNLYIKHSWTWCSQIT